MLWVCLHFPALPLEVFCPSPETPMAVENEDGRQRTVLMANPAAQATGITPGMSVHSARGLCATLILRSRDMRLEQEHLERMALLGYQFSPFVKIQPDRQLWLEIESCLRLFGGCDALLKRLTAALDEEGMTWQIACYPTARGASVLARDQGLAGSARVFPREALSACRLESADLAPSLIERLRGTGFTTLGELFLLPGHAIARRFGQDTLVYLNALQGRHPDLRPHYTPPDHFHASCELGHECTHAQPLLFPLRRLLEALERYLHARQSLALEILLTLQHRDDSVTAVNLSPAEGACQSSLLLDLFRLRLEHLTLTSPVMALRITVDHLAARPGLTADLFAPPSGAVDAPTLVERLRARLGHEAVSGLGSVADHRPEWAWRPLPPGDTGTGPASPYHRLRPAWLVDPPRRLRSLKGMPADGGRLHLLQGPERIETGWWDDQPIQRDYYVAQHPDGRLCWLFRPVTQPDQWFLQGWFS